MKEQSRHTMGKLTVRSTNSLDPIPIEVPKTLCGKVVYPTIVVARVERLGRFNEEGPANAKQLKKAWNYHYRLVSLLESFLQCPSVGSDGPGSTTLRVMDVCLDGARNLLKEMDGDKKDEC